MTLESQRPGWIGATVAQKMWSWLFAETHTDAPKAAYVEQVPRAVVVLVSKTDGHAPFAALVDTFVVLDTSGEQVLVIFSRARRDRQTIAAALTLDATTALSVLGPKALPLARQLQHGGDELAETQYTFHDRRLAIVGAALTLDLRNVRLIEREHHLELTAQVSTVSASNLDRYLLAWRNDFDSYGWSASPVYAGFSPY